MIQLHLMGAVDLRRDGAEVRAVLSQPKRLALLAYLAAAHPRAFHNRDTLLALFWPEADTERARNALRQAVHYLRRSLGEGAVVSRGDQLGVDPEQLWCDAAAFDAALEQGREQDALELYRGDFLPGVFVEDAPDVERWLDEERDRRRRAAVKAASALADRAAANGEMMTAALWARRASSLVPHDEAMFRRLFGLLVGAGETAAAVEAATEFTRRLAEDYGVGPSEETARAIEDARQRQPSREAVRVTARPVEHALLEPAAAARIDEKNERTPDTKISPATSGPRRRWLVAVVLVAVVLGGGGWFARTRLAPAETPAIAVLPFINLSGDAGNEYFSDGVTEELLNVLAQVPGLRVASRTSAFAFKGKDVGVDSIGRALRVGYVLEGSIRTDADTVRITAQLIDAKTGFHVWSRNYDREVRDIFDVQDEISRAIVDHLSIKLTGRRADGPLAREQTSDPEAHALALRAASMFAQSTREAYDEAASMFEEAIRRDPNYARAYSSLALVRIWQANHRYIPLDEGYAQARALAEKAQTIDPYVSDPLVVLGWIAMTRDWDFARAQELFQRAEDLTPGDRRIPNYRAILLMRLGRQREAVAAAERVTLLDPTFTGGFSNLAAMYAIVGDYERAKQTHQMELKLAPADPTTYVGMTMTYSLAAQFDSAIAFGEKAVSLMKDDQYAIATLGYAYARAGRTDDAVRMLDMLEKQEHASVFLRAMVNAGLGRADTMFALLEQAVAARDDAVPDLPADPVFRPYRPDPRMQALLRRIRSS